MKKRPIVVIMGSFVLVAAVVCGKVAQSRLAPRPGVREATTGSNAGSFVAYSLNAAKQRVESGKSEPGLDSLGGIKSVAGMVFDPVARDLILVGQVVPGQPSLSLQDLVVALRALLLRHQYPLVSIDRTPQTKTTGLQTVRWEGGIQGTEFGASLVAADVALKKIVLRDIPEAQWGGKSYYSRVEADTATRAETERIGTLFWFHAMDPVLSERLGVFAISRLDVGVETEVISRNGHPIGQAVVHDRVGEAFAADLSGRYSRVSAINPDVARLRGLFALVAVATGIRSLAPKVDLDYWLHRFEVSYTATPKDYPLITHRSAVNAGGRTITVEVNGGVQLRALLLRLKDGDVTAIRDLVLKSRPDPETLVWRIPIRDWRIPGSSTEASLTSKDAPPELPANIGTSIEMNTRFGAGGPAIAEPRREEVGSLKKRPDAYLPPLLPPPGGGPRGGLWHGPDDHGGSGGGVPSPATRGGVMINPKPVLAGKGGADLRDKVLQSRPADGGLTWKAEPTNHWQMVSSPAPRGR